MDFSHEVHVGFDPDSGEFSVLWLIFDFSFRLRICSKSCLILYLIEQGLPEQWGDLLKGSGITKTEIAQNPQVHIYNTCDFLFWNIAHLNVTAGNAGRAGVLLWQYKRDLRWARHEIHGIEGHIRCCSLYLDVRKIDIPSTVTNILAFILTWLELFFFFVPSALFGIDTPSIIMLTAFMYRYLHQAIELLKHSCQRPATLWSVICSRCDGSPIYH